MIGIIKKLTNGWYVEHEGMDVPVVEYSRFQITEGLKVEFETIRNPNSGWRSNEPEKYAKIIRIVDNETKNK